MNWSFLDVIDTPAAGGDDGSASASALAVCVAVDET